MEKLTQFFNMIDRGEEHVGKYKRFYMFAATIFLNAYALIIVKPPSINFQIILALATSIIPVIAMISALLDFISLKGKELYIKVITRAGVYIAIYFILIFIETKFFQ